MLQSLSKNLKSHFSKQTKMSPNLALKSETGLNQTASKKLKQLEQVYWISSSTEKRAQILLLTILTVSNRKESSKEKKLWRIRKKFNLGSSKNVLHCSIRTNSINTPKSLGVRKPVFGKPIILQRVKSPNVTPKALKNKEKIISLKQRKLSIFLHSPKKKSATDVKYSATPKNGIMTQGNNNMIKELGLRRSETNEFKLFPVKYKESILEISKSDVFEKSLLEDISSVEEFSDIEECGTPLLDYCNKIDTKRRLERNGVLTKFAFPNLKNTSKNGKLGENRKEFRIRRRTKKDTVFFLIWKF